MQRVHRLEWAKHHGPIPPGMCVLHRCDNPPCYEIAHLFIGTQQDNVADRDAKGRTSRVSRSQGELHGLSRLSEGAVRSIRAEYAAGALQRQIAVKYGISQPHVSEIVRGIKWRHLT